MMLFLCLVLASAVGSTTVQPNAWFVDQPLPLENQGSPCYDGRNRLWGPDYNVAPVPGDSRMPKTWDPNGDGTHTVGFYLSTGTSNRGLSNFKNTWAPMAGVDM